MNDSMDSTSRAINEAMRAIERYDCRIENTWRPMEQFSAIARHGSVWSGDLISKAQTRELKQRGLVCWSNRRNGYVLTLRGLILWWLWRPWYTNHTEPDLQSEKQSPPPPTESRATERGLGS